MVEAAVKETETATMFNGIEVGTLAETVKAIKDDPELGIAQFRATNKWLAGNHNRTTVTDFYGAKQDIAHAQQFKLDADEPAILAGNDFGANPVEHLLHALVSCVTTSMVAHAAVRGIPVRSVESIIEGDINLNGYLGLSDDVPRGYTALRVKFKVDADLKYHERLLELAKYSPVFNTITNSASVDISLEPK
jgi:uncharacterized OsmC-like protein